jgi:coenzyme F420-0:L-glutamate ligase
MQLFGIKTPIIMAGEDMVKVLVEAMARSGIVPQENDIIVLAESAVATAEGRIVRLDEVVPSPEALEMSKTYDTDPRKMELILRESDEILGGIPGVVVTITKGVLSPSAGIDSSNVPEGYVSLLPADPKRSAELIREKLMAEYGCKIAVIVGDSRTQPLRLGCVGIALGCAGIEPVEDARGKRDLFGKPLTITRCATADNLVSAAQLLMGEADEGIPAVLIRGAKVRFMDSNVEIPQIPREECLYFGCFTRSKPCS